jgi:hypothetical protein
MSVENRKGITFSFPIIYHWKKAGRQLRSIQVIGRQPGKPLPSESLTGGDEIYFVTEEE